MRRYDFALNWSGKRKEKFVQFLQSQCAQSRLSFLWVDEKDVKSLIKQIESRKVYIRVLLDTEATYNKKDDLYARLCYRVKDSGGVVINDPDRTKTAIDKSVAHFELVNSGITTPYTIMVRNWQPYNFRLSEEERKKLGVPFIIKPALGYGQLGVVRDARGSIREIARARNYDKGDNFLLQEKIMPISIGGTRAWFRVFNVFDTIIPCWWDDQQNKYAHVMYEEFNSYRLYPLAKIVSKIAALTRMVWFSTEIAIDKKYGFSRFVAIDYVNDQCDMSTLSETVSGVPDPVVAFTAERIVKASQQMIYNQKLSRKYTIFLGDATIELRGLGVSPDALTQSLAPESGQRKHRQKTGFRFFRNLYIE